MRETLGDEHRITLWTRQTCAVIAQLRGRLDEADAVLLEVAATAYRTLPSNPLGGVASMMRAIGLAELGRFDEAEKPIATAIEWTTRKFGERHPFLTHLRGIAAVIARGRGDLARAEETLREIAATQRQRLGPHHFMTTFTEGCLIELLLERGHAVEAEKLARSLPDAERAISGNRGTRWLRARSLLGRAVLDCGRSKEAENLLGEVVRDAERLVPGGFLQLPEIRMAYGRSLMQLSRLGEAETQLLRAYGTMAEMRGVQHVLVHSCAGVLADLFTARGDPRQGCGVECEEPVMNWPRCPPWFSSYASIVDEGKILGCSALAVIAMIVGGGLSTTRSTKLRFTGYTAKRDRELTHPASACHDRTLNSNLVARSRLTAALAAIGAAVLRQQRIFVAGLGRGLISHKDLVGAHPPGAMRRS